MKVINDLLGYKLKIIQDNECFNFSLESALLPNFVSISKNTYKILDVGTGNAPIPMILSTRTNAKIVGIEVQKQIYLLAKESVSINNLDNQIEIINSDFKDINKLYEAEFFDIIISNPPYFELLSTKNKNIDIRKEIARHETMLDLATLIRESARLLKNKGIFAMVHQSERLTEIINELEKNNLTAKKIQFIHAREDQNSFRVMIEAVKNAKKGIKVLEPIIVHDKEGKYRKSIVDKYFKR